MPIAPSSQDCRVLELRQYTLHRGQRDTLVDLFDREFVETQEAAGMRIIGQFRDLDDADRFVWLRGFADMQSRRAALTAFYDGPVWAAHRDAARATMVDTSDALLLKPARPGAGFDLSASRPGPGAVAVPPGIVACVVHGLETSADAVAAARLEAALAPRLAEAGAAFLASFVTDTSANTFPRLPVREGEEVYIWLAASPDGASLGERLPGLAEIARQALGEGQILQRLRLAPTSRSQLRA